MAEGDETSSGFGDRDQDEYVRQLRPDPAQPPQRGLDLTGLLGDSGRAGYRRLYFNRALDYYAEFRVDDVLYVESVPPDEPPLVGLAATRVTLRRDALVSYARDRQASATDEFDLDVQFQRAHRFLLPVERTPELRCVTIPPDCGITDVTCECWSRFTGWCCAPI